MGSRAYDRSFTAGLFLAAGLTGGVILRLLWLWGQPFGRDDFLGFYYAVLAGWALLALVPACLRVLGVRWAWRITDLCLFPLLFWFPLGTGLFVWWRLGLREREEYRLEHLY